MREHVIQVVEQYMDADRAGTTPLPFLFIRMQSASSSRTPIAGQRHFRKASTTLPAS